MSFSDGLVAFITQELLEDGEAFGPDDGLIDRGLLDSIGLMQIIQYVEDNAGVRVPDADVTPDNFNTVRSIEALVDRLKNR